MKTRTALIPLVFASALLLAVTGCRLFGPAPAPPGAFEAKLFTVVTNYVPEIQHVIETNHVDVIRYVTRTNEVGVTVVLQVTNTVDQYRLLEVTNMHEVYDWKPKPLVNDTAQTAGVIGNLVAPGSGGLVTGIILGLAGAWAKLRSSKKTGGVLAQNIETMREFLKTLPNGAQYDSVITRYLQDHQLETGVVNQVTALLQNYVSEGQARNSLAEIQNALAALQPAK